MEDLKHSIDTLTRLVESQAAKRDDDSLMLLSLVGKVEIQGQRLRSVEKKVDDLLSAGRGGGQSQQHVISSPTPNAADIAELRSVKTEILQAVRGNYECSREILDVVKAKNVGVGRQSEDLCGPSTTSNVDTAEVLDAIKATCIDKDIILEAMKAFKASSVNKDIILEALKATGDAKVEIMDAVKETSNSNDILEVINKKSIELHKHVEKELDDMTGVLDIHRNNLNARWAKTENTVTSSLNDMTSELKDLGQRVNSLESTDVNLADRVRRITGIVAVGDTKLKQELSTFKTSVRKSSGLINKSLHRHSAAVRRLQDNLMYDCELEDKLGSLSEKVEKGLLCLDAMRRGGTVAGTGVSGLEEVEVVGRGWRVMCSLLTGGSAISD